MSETKGPPPGFNKAVNDSLIPAATLVHLKAAALLGVALTLTGLVVGRGRPEGSFTRALHAAGVVMLGAAASAAGYAMYPRKKVRRGGLIFWGDIVTHRSAAAYAEATSALTAPGLEAEYAQTNYHLSRVLNAKFGLIRWSVALLLLGSFLAVGAHFFQ